MVSLPSSSTLIQVSVRALYRKGTAGCLLSAKSGLLCFASFTHSSSVSAIWLAMTIIIHQRKRINSSLKALLVRPTVREEAVLVGEVGGGGWE